MKKIILSAFIALTTLVSSAQVRVLYYSDYSVGTDQLNQAMVNLGYLVTPVTDNPTFQSLIATPANYDLAIYFSQNMPADLTSVTALANFVSLGKKGMYADYAGNNTAGALVGVNYTGSNNQTQVLISDPAFASTLATNPFTLTNTGWGIFSTGMTPLTGSTVLGTFTSTGQAALIRSMSDDMLVFGYLSDVVASPELFETALESLAPPTISTTSMAGTMCAGSTFNVSYTITGTFNAGNVFTAELSDATGSFASPVAIGTLTSTSAGTISFTIPTSTSTGSAYRIRVVSSDPVVTGTDNGTDLVINAKPTVTAVAPATTICR